MAPATTSGHRQEVEAEPGVEATPFALLHARPNRHVHALQIKAQHQGSGRRGDVVTDNPCDALHSP